MAPRYSRLTLGEIENQIALASMVQRLDCGCVFAGPERVAMCEEHAKMFGMAPYGIVPSGHERCSTCGGAGFVKKKKET